MNWHIAMVPDKRKALDNETSLVAILEKLEQTKVSIRDKWEHAFRVIKCQFGLRKVRYRGLANNNSKLLLMFALSNLWMVRKQILQGCWNEWACSMGKSPKWMPAHQESEKSAVNLAHFSSLEHSRINSRCSGGYEDHT